MRREDISVATDDGACPTLVVRPDGDGPWTPVILFMDAGGVCSTRGVRPAMVEMAERLAGTGHVAVVPEMYHRHGDYEPFDMARAFADEDERGRLMGMIGSVTPETLAVDLDGVLAALDAMPDVDATRIGTTGYCMGGRLSLLAAADHPDRVVGAASFHGGGIGADAPGSPLHRVADIAGRVYVAAAENDPTFPEEQAEALEAALSAAGVDHRMETYPARHGFAVPDSPSFDADAAERHWRALAELFGATLSD